MGSFLFAMFQGGGNVPLILPIVRRLAARGHHVHVLAGPLIWVPRPPPADALAEAARGVGATATVIASPLVNPMKVRRNHGGCFADGPRTSSAAPETWALQCGGLPSGLRL